MSWTPSALPRGGGAVRLLRLEAGAELVLDNPRARNAVTPGMMADLAAAVASLDEAPPRWVLVRGEGEAAFCAGGDLSAVEAWLLEPGGGAGMCAYMTAVLGRLASLPCVVMAAVEGAALGGGAELLTACDLVVAAEGARIGFVQARLGVSPGWGGAARLSRRVGRARAVELLAFAATLSAEEARCAGLVDRVVPRGTAAAFARAWLGELAALPEAALRAAVAVARDPAIEAPVFASLWAGPDHRAALARLGRGRP